MCSCPTIIRNCAFGLFFVITVHKNRDVIPLNINEDMEESDEDTEQPVLDFEVELLTFWLALE